MYCKNCGSPMDEKAVLCVRCGCARGTGISYCPHCGGAVTPGVNGCPNCGKSTGSVTGQKSKVAAGLLGIFLGVFGVHNFYLGKTGRGVTQLLLCLLSCFVLSPVTSIWGLIEGIMILAGEINVDGHGLPLKD